VIDSPNQPQGRVYPTSVSSNGVELPFDDRTFARQQESPPWPAARETVRATFRDNGYVLLRGLLDREYVLGLRADYFARFDRRMLAPGTSSREGIFSGTVPDDLPEYGTAGHPAHDFVRTDRFDAFTRTPALQEVAEVLLGGPTELLPRRILRHYDRSTRRASRAHVDYDYMDHGSDQLVTAWVPLGDCPVQCGGLLYLEGSHRIPPAELDPLRDHTDRPHDRRPVSHDLGRTARQLGGRWLWTDYRAGDVVLHSPHLVHATLDNTSDVMRLSADLRFRRQDAAADERWNGAWSADDGF
jgi:ectoine hydroxylase-related dioxygenase (phytanoyl-CoA dioxygenase family)